MSSETLVTHRYFHAGRLLSLPLSSASHDALPFDPVRAASEVVMEFFAFWCQSQSFTPPEPDSCQNPLVLPSHFMVHFSYASANTFSRSSYILSGLAALSDFRADFVHFPPVPVCCLNTWVWCPTVPAAEDPIAPHSVPNLWTPSRRRFKLFPPGLAQRLLNSAFTNWISRPAGGSSLSRVRPYFFAAVRWVSEISLSSTRVGALFEL